MENVLAVVFGVWFWIGVFSSFYFYVKKTNRSQAPIVRRFLALGYGLAWPVMVIMYFAGRDQAEAEERKRRAAQDRILGG